MKSWQTFFIIAGLLMLLSACGNRKLIEEQKMRITTFEEEIAALNSKLRKKDTLISEAQHRFHALEEKNDRDFAKLEIEIRQRLLAIESINAEAVKTEKNVKELKVLLEDILADQNKRQKKALKIMHKSQDVIQGDWRMNYVEMAQYWSTELRKMELLVIKLKEESTELKMKQNSR